MKTAILVIDGVIGEQDPMLSVFGLEDNTISSQSVAAFLADNKDADTIEIEIRSNGGSVSHGFDIYDQLINSGKTIITKGFRVNSIATVIFLAGSKRYLSKNAEFIVHNPWVDPMSLGGMMLTADVLETITADVQATEDKLFNFYSEKLKLDAKGQEDLRAIMDKDSDIGAAEAIQFGFATDYLEQKVKAAIFTEMIIANYKQKSNNYSTMNNEIKEKLSGIEKFQAKILNLLNGKKEIVAGSVMLDDGTSLWYAEDTPAVGINVFSDEAMQVPAADGEYPIDNGDVLVIAGGAITEIRIFQAEAEEVVALKAKVAELETALETATTEKQNAVDANTEIKKEFDNMATEIAAFKKLVIGAEKKAEKKKVEAAKADQLPPWKQRLIADQNKTKF